MCPNCESKNITDVLFLEAPEYTEFYLCSECSCIFLVFHFDCGSYI